MTSPLPSFPLSSDLAFIEIPPGEQAITTHLIPRGGHSLSLFNLNLSLKFHLSHSRNNPIQFSLYQSPAAGQSPLTCLLKKYHLSPKTRQAVCQILRLQR